MDEKMTYEEANARLEAIVQEIETETLSIDALADKVKQAKTLLQTCEQKLHAIDEEVTQLLKEMEEDSLER